MKITELIQEDSGTGNNAANSPAIVVQYIDRVITRLKKEAQREDHGENDSLIKELIGLVRELRLLREYIIKMFSHKQNPLNSPKQIDLPKSRLPEPPASVKAHPLWGKLQNFESVKRHLPKLHTKLIEAKIIP
jgi:hypothetical protein